MIKMVEGVKYNLRKTMFSIRNLSTSSYVAFHMFVPVICGALIQYISHSAWYSIPVGVVAIGVLNGIEKLVASK